MDVDEALRWAEEGGSYRCSTIDSDVFKVLAAEVRRLRDMPLPCDVTLPPATTIKAGCKLSTLIHALELRTGPGAGWGNK